MEQSPLIPVCPGLHVAVIMDGNGRWAMSRGQPRVVGHRAGAKVVRKIVEGAPDLGIGTLTLYAFSSDNWKRPGREVSGLMRLFRAYLASETARCVQNGVRMDVIGRRDRIPPVLRKAIEASEMATADGTENRMPEAAPKGARSVGVWRKRPRKPRGGGRVARGALTKCRKRSIRRLPVGTLPRGSHLKVRSPAALPTPNSR